jgi:uncharacterized SAM-binding protein YcdF (DUF218 family)
LSGPAAVGAQDSPEARTLALARVVWDYHLLHQPLQTADVILVLGSHDLRVAEHGARLFLEGWAPLIVFSGGEGRLTAGIYAATEAERFAAVALEMGVPPSAVLTETTSRNTGENVRHSRRLLAEAGAPAERVIAVHKPYMERRTWATFKRAWPEPVLTVTSPPISFDDYPNAQISRAALIHLIVGDMQRILVYPDMGYQIAQETPPAVLAAYEALVAQGYTRELLADGTGP